MLQKIRNLLPQFKEYYLGIDFSQAKVIKSIELEEQNTLKIVLTFGFPLEEYKKQLIHELNAFIEKELSLSIHHWKIHWEIESHIQPHAVKAGIKRLKPIKNVIAVASGKGGVGKSTVAVNLALTLKKEGANVGLLDADIYGPSQACMLGVREPAISEDGKHFKPTMAYGLHTLSMAYLIEKEETPMIWRGPMIGKALEQLFFDTSWPELDYLIVDLPPGTGDISLTLIQKIPLTATIIVTTPQKVALLDVRKALTMFAKVGIPVLGIVENMASYVCPSCGHASHIFGEKGGEIMSEQYSVPLLGRLMLDEKMCKKADEGVPWMEEKEFEATENNKVFHEIARRACAQLSLMKIDYSGKLPDIVIA